MSESHSVSDNLKSLTRCPKHFPYSSSKLNWNIVQKPLAKRETGQQKGNNRLRKENHKHGVQYSNSSDKKYFITVSQ